MKTFIAVVRLLRTLWTLLGEDGRRWVGSLPQGEPEQLGRMLANVALSAREMRAQQERELRERSKWSLDRDGKVKPRGWT